MLLGEDDVLSVIANFRNRFPNLNSLTFKLSAYQLFFALSTILLSTYVQTFVLLTNFSYSNLTSCVQMHHPKCVRYC